MRKVGCTCGTCTASSSKPLLLCWSGRRAKNARSKTQNRYYVERSNERFWKRLGLNRAVPI